MCSLTRFVMASSLSTTPSRVRWGNHFKVVLHCLDPVEPLGNIVRRLLGRVGIDLSSKHHLALRGFDIDLSPFDATIGRERNLGFRWGTYRWIGARD